MRAVTGYDEAGRVAGEQVVIPAVEGKLAGTYLTTKAYSDDGSLWSTGLPKLGELAAETLNYSYDAFGRRDKVNGATSYVTDTKYTALGEVAQVVLGTADKPLWRTSFYDPGTSRLSQVKTQRDAEGNVLATNQTYTYDQEGNVTRITDQIQGRPLDTQCFTYDHLRRTKAAWTATDNCAGAPAAGAIGGPAPYWQEYSYDLTGNRTKLVAKGLSGAADKVSSYAYAEPGGDLPHAVRSVTSGTTVASYEYDATGNTTSRTGPDGQPQPLVWDNEGLLSAVGASKYVYDADGQVLIRRDAGSATLFLGDGELKETGGVLKGTRYYDDLGVRTGAGFTWTVPDRSGTSQTALDAATLSISTRLVDPFGVPRQTATGWTGGDRGFVGGRPTAGTGLTRLGAREYDPALGRFLSVDPVIDPADPQQLNAYAYANNSPATFTDPDGRYLIEGDSGPTYSNQAAVNNAAAKKASGGKKKSNGPKLRGSKAAVPRGMNLCKLVKCTDFHNHQIVKNWLAEHMTADTLDLVRRYSKEAGIDPQLLLAILITESGDSHSGVKNDYNPFVESTGLGNLQRLPFLAAQVSSGGAMKYGYDDTWNLSDDGNVHRSMRAAALYIGVLQRNLEETVGTPKYVTQAQAIRIGYNMGAGLVDVARPNGERVTFDLGGDNMRKVALLDRAPRGEHAKKLKEFSPPIWSRAGCSVTGSNSGRGAGPAGPGADVG